MGAWSCLSPAERLPPGDEKRWRREKRVGVDETSSSLQHLLSTAPTQPDVSCREVDGLHQRHGHSFVGLSEVDLLNGWKLNILQRFAAYFNLMRLLNSYENSGNSSEFWLKFLKHEFFLTHFDCFAELV